MLAHSLGTHSIRLFVALVAILIVQVTNAQEAGSSAIDRLRQIGPESLVRTSRFACSLELHRLQKKISQGLTMEEYARLEVAFVEGKELYSWPGEASFHEDELRDLLVAGLSGSGSFGGHLRAVIFGDDTEFGSAAPAEQADPGAAGSSPVVSIPYRVPASKSGYLVNVDGREIESAIAGEILVSLKSDAPSIVGFTLHAVDLPDGFPAKEVAESIAFSGGVAGSGVSGVPREASQRMVERSGDEYANRLRFLACREFQGAASIRFEDADSSVSPTRGLDGESSGGGLTTSTRPVPAGVPVDLALVSSIQWNKQQSGDEIEAVVTRDVRFKGSTVFREGARARGRLVEWKRVSGKSEGMLVGLVLTEVVDGNMRYPVTMVLEALTGMPKGNRRGIAAMVHGEQARFRLIERTGARGRPLPRGGFFQAIGPELEVPKGLEMRWVTSEHHR